MATHIEYPQFNSRERVVAESAVKKLARLPDFRKTAGEIVFAANISRGISLPEISTVQPVVPVKSAPDIDVLLELPQPSLSLEEWRVVGKALPALLADGKISPADVARYEDLCRSQPPRIRELAMVNRRFFLGWGAGLGVSYAATIASVGLASNGFMQERQITKKVDDYMRNLYQNDHRDLSGRLATTPQQLKEDVEMRVERKKLTNEMLMRKGWEGAEVKIALGLTFSVITTFISAAVTVHFIDDLIDKIVEWKGKFGRFRVNFKGNHLAIIKSRYPYQ